MIEQTAKSCVKRPAKNVARGDAWEALPWGGVLLTPGFDGSLFPAWTMRLEIKIDPADSIATFYLLSHTDGTYRLRVVSDSLIYYNYNGGASNAVATWNNGADDVNDGSLHVLHMTNPNDRCAVVPGSSSPQQIATDDFDFNIVGGHNGTPYPAMLIRRLRIWNVNNTAGTEPTGTPVYDWKFPQWNF